MSSESMALLQEPAYHRSLFFWSAHELMTSPQPEHIPLACLQPLDLLEQPQVMPLTTQTALPPTPSGISSGRILVTSRANLVGFGSFLAL